jgi:hypothetical protein
MKLAAPYPDWLSTISSFFAMFLFYPLKIPFAIIKYPIRYEEMSAMQIC